jgi:hypothetical protein
MSNDSVIDENLHLWKCHPEKVCINCRHFSVQEKTEGYSDYTPGNDFEMYCSEGKWVLSGEDSEKQYRKNLLMARKCDKLELREPSLPGEV